MTGEKQWLTYGEAARVTGRSGRTIRRWVQERRLHVFLNRVNRRQLLEVEAGMRRARRTGVKAGE
ncbi:putative site-specific integrase-resolvase [Brevibacterium pityocampae]